MALQSTLGDSDTDYDAAVASGNILNVFAVLEKENGLPAGYLAKTAKVESGMNPNAQNPHSSAGGLFQFINSTANRYGLTDKMDPVASSLAAAQLAADNKDYLSSRLGREPSDVELYAAHQQGPAGAAKIIANPNASMASLVGGEAARLNAASGITGGQFIDRFAKKFGSPSVAGGRGISTEPTPEADMPAADAVPTSGFRTGAMASSYTPEEEGWNVPVGNTISAIGQALLSGTRQSPLANLPQIMATQKALADKREDRRYGMYRDNRDFAFRQTESDRAQTNADRGFGLQERQVNMTAEERKVDNARADAALDLQRQQAGAPKIMTDGSGAVLAVKPDGTGVTTLAPGQKIQTESGKVAERRAIAKEYGLEEGSAAFNTYLLNGKLPDGAVPAPTTKTIKQADGSEVAVQWDAAGGKWIPLTAPEGGNPVRPGGAKLTEGQSKDLGFFNRGSAAMENLQKHEEALRSGTQTALGKAPVIGNMLTSEDYKLGNQAGREFLAAILRKDSGGAITEEENKGYGKIFLPQPGDTPAVLDQKRESRRIAIESIRDGLGTAQALARVTPKGDTPTVRTNDEYNALPPGTPYIDPFGKKRVKGGG